MSHSQYYGEYGGTKGENGIPYGDHIVAATTLLIWHPCPFGLPVILDVAYTPGRPRPSWEEARCRRRKKESHPRRVWAPRQEGSKLVGASIIGSRIVPFPSTVL